MTDSKTKKTKNTKRYRIVGTDLLRNKKPYPQGAVLDDLSDEEAAGLSHILEPVGPDAVHEKAPGDYRDFDFNPDGSIHQN